MKKAFSSFKKIFTFGNRLDKSLFYSNKSFFSPIKRAIFCVDTRQDTLNQYQMEDEKKNQLANKNDWPYCLTGLICQYNLRCAHFHAFHIISFSDLLKAFGYTY